MSDYVMRMFLSMSVAEFRKLRKALRILYASGMSEFQAVDILAGAWMERRQNQKPMTPAERFLAK